MSNAKREIANELHKAARKNFKRRKTIIKHFADLYQSDLAEFQPYAKVNNGYRYILIVIDCFSKFLWTRPLKNKTAEEVEAAMRDIFEKVKYTPKHLQTDLGKEFYNKRFSKLMKDYQINHYSTFSTKKAAIAERVIRTIKTWLYKEFSVRGEYKWIDILDSITEKYNNKVHSTTGMRPVDVTSATKLNVYNRPKLFLKAKYKIGDIVRLSKYKAVFEKGYTPNYSTELFKIVKVQITNPVTYLLEDLEQKPIKGCFYESELQKTKFPDTYLIERVLKTKGTKLFVSWLGLPPKFNSWIDKHDIT